MNDLDNRAGWEAENSRLRAESESLKAELAQAIEKADAAKEMGLAMLLMLEDMEKTRKDIEISKKTWEATFDSFTDLVFSHDKEMRLIRANKSYLAASGASRFSEIIGKLYYEVFPKMDGPLSSCLRALENNKAEEEEEED